MVTVLGKEGDNFYTAFYEPDHKKRKKSLDKWVKKTTPAVQKAVTEELKSLVDFVMENRWTDEGWKAGEEKLRRIQPDYHLVMDIKLRSLTGRERKDFKGELPASAFKKEEKVQDKQGELPASAFKKGGEEQGKQSGVEEDGDDYEDAGRSPNDDRSDSMNPNNDAYQASMDNRSDQMNPNNSSYWSSRGR